jgi:hypothetical protein
MNGKPILLLLGLALVCWLVSRRVGDTQPPQGESHPDPGVAGNERLTALAGAVLLALMVAEVVTVPAVRTLMPVHVFVGITLAGPLAIKTASTGWRFIRYYTNNPAYRRKGPPHPLLRALAPLLLISTLVEVGSGIGLVTTHPGNQGVLARVHLVGFLVWVTVVGIHVLAYIRRVPGLIASDWRHDHVRQAPAPGRGQRLAVNLAALLGGVIAAILVLPAFTAWTHW